MLPRLPHDHRRPSVSSLYCGGHVSNADTWISARSPDPFSSSPPPPSFYPFPVGSDDAVVVGLIDLETRHMPRSDYLQRCRDRSIDVTARQDSINWILRVHAHYHFRPATAFLSVNYLDRFLSFHSLPRERWAFQLLSVACLSLAAKMEEPDVPLLLDLQVFDPKFLFEPRTVQRMELWVMSNLNWRLHSVTPFDFLHSFIPKLPSLSSSSSSSLCRVLSASSNLIVSTTRVIDFLGFTPSTIAAATVLCAAGEGSDEPPVFHDSLDVEMVRSCRQLMEEYLVDTCPSATVKVAEPEPPAAPPSPVGVLDAAACKSCETRSDIPSTTTTSTTAATTTTTSRAEPPPPPPNRRLRFSALESSSNVQEN